MKIKKLDREDIDSILMEEYKSNKKDSKKKGSKKRDESK